MAPGAWSELVAAVLAASRQAVEVLADDAVSPRWEEPSVLPEMSVGQLSAHLGQMIGGPAGWLRTEPPDPAGVSIGTNFSMYQVARLDPEHGLDGDVATTIRRWADAGASHGPAQVVDRARSDLAETAELFADAAPDRLIPSAVSPAVATCLADYLRTRCVELVVHTDDLAASVGIESPTPDPVAAGIAIDVLTTMCRNRAGDLAVLRGLTRPDRCDLDALRAL